VSAPLGPSPFAAPRDARDARPAVILWFRVYAAMMTVAMLALLAVGLLAASAASAAGDAAYVMIGASALLAPFFAVATLVPFKPWGWSVALVAIALGLASAGIVFAVPLMIAWFRPTVKAAFARL